MIARLMSVITVIGVLSGMFYFFNWVGQHFTDAPAQAVLGFSPTFVGMVLVCIAGFVGWFVLGVVFHTVSYIVKG